MPLAGAAHAQPVFRIPPQETAPRERGFPGISQKGPWASSATRVLGSPRQPWCGPARRTGSYHAVEKATKEASDIIAFPSLLACVKNGDREEKGSISHYQISNPPRKHLLNLGSCHGISSSVACCFIGCSQRCPVYHNA